MCITWHAIQPANIQNSPFFSKVIDGVKILCIGTDPAFWEQHPLLSFSTKIDEQTGEIKSDTKTAFFKGLHFFLIPSTKNDNVHCILRGSLARYYNNGKDNAFDFNCQMLYDTIKDIQTRFKVDPLQAVVQNFEYGLNIDTTLQPKKIIRGLRAYQSDCFTSLKVDEVFNGKQISKQEYQYKIYDKALQLHRKNRNIIRIELAIKSTKKAKTYGISVFADLLNVDNLGKIKPDLIKVWEDMIFYDSGMKWRLMNKKQKEKMLFYLDATNWEKFNRKQRFRAKNIFISLRTEFCTSTTQVEILHQILSKIKELTAKKGNALRNLEKELTAEKGNALRSLFNENISYKKERFTDLDKGVKRGQNHILKITSQKQGNCVKAIIPKCKVCSADISHKKEGTIYCSKRCNNVEQSKRKKKRRRQNLTIEKNDLKRILKILPISQLSLIITYKQKNLYYSDEVMQKGLYIPDETIRSVQRVELKHMERIVFTSFRARKIIKTIIELNERTSTCCEKVL